MVKIILEKFLIYFKKIPPWQAVLGGILVIVIFLAIFFSISAKNFLIIDRDYLLNNLAEEESFFWLNYFKKLNLKKIELIYKKKQTKIEITGHLVKQDELPMERIINFLEQFDYNLKLFKKKNTLLLAGKTEEKLVLPENNLLIAKNLKFAQIFLASNLNLEKLFSIDNLENNLSQKDRKIILGLLSQLKELSIEGKSNNSFDYIGVLNYNSQKELEEYEYLFSKIISFTKLKEVIKKLPDNTEVIELVNQPQDFPFQDENFLNFVIRCQRMTEKNWQICYLKNESKKQIYFATNLDQLKKRLSDKMTLELIDLTNNPNFLDDDKLLILKNDLLNYSGLAKKIFSDLPEFSYLVIVEKGSGFKIISF